jgi:hypothetical protein
MDIDKNLYKMSRLELRMSTKLVIFFFVFSSVPVICKIAKVSQHISIFQEMFGRILRELLSPL